MTTQNQHIPRAGVSKSRPITSLVIERWYWILVFCLISFGIQRTLAFHGRVFSPVFVPPGPTEMDIELQPLPEETPKAVAAQEPPKTPEEAVQDRVRQELLKVASNRTNPAVPIVMPAPAAPAKAAPGEKVTAPPAPVAASTGGLEKIKDEMPTAAGVPSGRQDAGEPRIERIARVEVNTGGGGSPSPGPVLGGHDGASTPEAPPEEVVFNGGGAGGVNLPKAKPRIGGGGGNPILSVDNPLAKDAIPEEKPGLGPGLGSGEGLGAGGGVGSSRGKGIGTSPDGTLALAALHTKPGSGIGAGSGSGIGTRAPGGGKGTGSELPGTGGEGTGYGRGKGSGAGDGEGPGIGKGRGARIGLTRGIPFGDLGGLLKGPGGGQNGGPGGEGRGGVFGAVPTGGGEKPIHIVYMLDVSGSMIDGNKIGKAKEALKQALRELSPRDSFNIITFYAWFRPFSDAMVPATNGNIEAANLFIDFAQLKDGTNFWDSLQAALSLEGVTHVFVLSDGEPTVKERNPEKIRDMVKLRNTHGVQINTLALGLGERFPGMMLLRGIAEDNSGKYAYINLHNR